MKFDISSVKQNIFTVKLSELKEYENNPRDNKDAVEYVKKSIAKYGMLVPIVIDKDNGTYIKSFYSVVVSPSCVQVGVMGGGGNGHTHNRLHHKVLWNDCAVCILREKYKK